MADEFLDIPFEEITEGCVVVLEEDFEDCNISADEPCEVVGTSGDPSKETYCLEFLYHCEEYDRAWYESMDKETWEDLGGKVLSVLSKEEKDNLLSFNKLVDEMSVLSKEANKVAPLGREVVVLSDRDDLIEWHSSRC